MQAYPVETHQTITKKYVISIGKHLITVNMFYRATLAPGIPTQWKSAARGCTHREVSPLVSLQHLHKRIPKCYSQHRLIFLFIFFFLLKQAIHLKRTLQICYHTVAMCIFYIQWMNTIQLCWYLYSKTAKGISKNNHVALLELDVDDVKSAKINLIHLRPILFQT